MVPLLRLLGGLLATALLLGACGGSGSVGSTDLRGWLAEDPAGAWFLQWTRSDDRVAGSVTMASLAGSRVDQESASFEGIINDGSVTLTFKPGFGVTTNWNGRLDHERLTLSYNTASGDLKTVVLRPAGREEFEAAVGALEAAAASVAATEAEAAREQAAAEAEAADAEAAERDAAEARRELDDALMDLESDVQFMAETLELMSDDVEAVRVGLETVRQEAAVEPMDSYQADAVGFAADSVGYSRDGVGYTLEEVKRQWKMVENGTATVQALARRLNDDSADQAAVGLKDQADEHLEAAEGLMEQAEDLYAQARRVAEEARSRAS